MVSNHGASSNVEGLAGLHSGMLGNSSLIMSAINSVESKCFSLLAANVAFIALVAAYAPLQQGLVSWMCVTLLFVSIFACYFGAKTTDYEAPTKLIEEDDDYLSMDNDSLYLHLISDAQAIVLTYIDVLQEKEQHFREAVLGTFLASIGVILSVMIGAII